MLVVTCALAERSVLLWIWDAAISADFWANFLDIFPGTIYLLASILGLSVSRRTTIYIDAPENVAQVNDWLSKRGST